MGGLIGGVAFELRLLWLSVPVNPSRVGTAPISAGPVVSTYRYPVPMNPVVCSYSQLPCGVPGDEEQERYIIALPGKGTRKEQALVLAAAGTIDESLDRETGRGYRFPPHLSIVGECLDKVGHEFEILVVRERCCERIALKFARRLA